MLSGWAKTGLFPFCPLKVLKDIQRPPAELRIPKGDEGIQIEKDAHLLSGPRRQQLQKMANTAQTSFVKCALLLDENRLLFE
ncbi:unnamed protein product [Alternaria alternata]